MKKVLLTVINIAVISFQMLSQSYTKIDLYNSQKIKYDFNEMMMEENACIDYGELYMRVPYFMDFIDTAIMSKLNQYYHNKMVLQLNSLEFRKLLSKHAINAEIAFDQNNDVKGSKQLMTCDFNQSLYVPSIIQVNAYIGTLINDILAVGVTYVYSTTVKNDRRMTNLRYNVLEYFNVKTGKIYTSNDVFLANFTSVLNQKINNAYKNNQYFVKTNELYNINTYEYDDYSPSVTVMESEIDREYGEVEAVEPPSPTVDDDEDLVVPEYNDNSSEDNTLSSPYNGYSKPFLLSNSVIDEFEFTPQKRVRELKEFNSNLHGMFGFNGANFYYIMPAFQPCHHLNDGQCLLFNFSYEDLRKMINPNGPFGFLLKLNVESRKNIFNVINLVTKNDELEYNGWLDIDKLELNPDEKVKKVNLYVPNYNFNQTIYRGNKTLIDTNKYTLKQTLFYQKGKIISKINREQDSSQNIYWNYEYNEQGLIKLMTKKNNGVLIYEHSYYYDKNNNLTKELESEYNQIISETHYLQTDNALLKYKTSINETQVFTANYLKNHKQLDSMHVIFENSYSLNSYRYDSLGNHILTYNNNGFKYFLYEGNRLMTVGSEFGLMDFTYNPEGKINLKKNNNGEEELIEYDSNGRISKVIHKNENSNESDVYGLENEDVCSMKFEYFD